MVTSDADRGFRADLELRRSRVSAQFDLAGRSFKSQMKQADRSGARMALIVEEDGSAKLRDMDSGDQRDVELDGTAIAEAVLGSRPE